MSKAIYFDMDGTIANLYGIENWAEKLSSNDVTPYEQAEVMLNMQSLAHRLNALQRNGYTIGIISWLAKNADNEYNTRVEEVKMAWLAKHLPSVKWDKISIVAYGTPKSTCGNGILFDDEEPNRKEWRGQAYDVDNIIEILKKLYTFIT